MAQISLTQLPAIIDSQYIGITFQHMDFLMNVKFEYEEAKATMSVYKAALEEAFVEIENRDTLIVAQREVQSIMILRQQESEAYEQRLNTEIERLNKDLKRNKKASKWKTLGGAVVIGVLVGVLLLN